MENINKNEIVAEGEETQNFVEASIAKDLEKGYFSAVQTRHPPEPSGYMHIGHIRNIILNYGSVKKFNGVCNLRYDDTNPGKESQEFVDSIQEDVKWLGYEWGNIYHATDYFEQNYEMAKKFIRDGNAYVCDLSADELRESRGTLTSVGTNSPYRNRSVEENLDLFERMKNGEFEAGSRCLRAKIDMASPNMNMRDPVIYRIQYLNHQRIGRSWNIYPSYDFAHPLDDSMEGVSHSICGPEFEDHLPLYNWVIENSGLKNKTKRIVYSNLYIKGAILGKRFIKKLVEDKKVDGFDDPRLYTIRGLRRRGVLAKSLIRFVNAAGFSKSNALIDPEFMNHFIRDDLNEVSRRVMSVLNPVRLVINNYDENTEEEIVCDDYPQNEQSTTHTHYFAKELLVERDDFMENPEPKFRRLFVGNEVRLKGAYIVKCTGFDKDENGNVTTIYADYDKETKSGSGCTKKVKGTIHFVNPKHSKKVEVRLFDDLVEEEQQEEVEGKERSTGDVKVNPNSKIVNNNCFVEDIDFDFETRYQFVRNGYFCLDSDSNDDKLVFNRTISLKDTKKTK